jgi:hypothetical protein
MDASNTSITASFFVGDGSKLTGIISETASYVNPLQQDVIITGSIISPQINSLEGYIFDNNLTASLNFNNRRLNDSNDVSSIDYEGRTLIDGNNESVITWNEGNFAPSTDDNILLGAENSRFRNGSFSRNVTIGGSNAKTIITTFSPDGINIVGGMIMATGSEVPSVTVQEGTMFLGKTGPNYYIYVYIGNQWRKAELFG